MPLRLAYAIAVVTLVVPAAFPAEVKLDQKTNYVAASIDGRTFTDYWFGKRDDRPYVRPFFFPVLAANGTPVTADHYGQKEHPHHNSLWVGHGEVNGADHWGLHDDKSPKQRHIRFEKVEGDTIMEDLEWEGTDHQPILKERRTMRFVVFPDSARGIEFTLQFTPIDGPVTFGDTKEAGLVSVRVSDAIPTDHPVLTNSRGAHGEKATWGRPANWCDISGQINGKEYGIAAFDHPNNPRHPTRWHVREYGLLAANPFGLSYFDKGTPRHTGDLTIELGKTVTFRYEVVVHEGDADSAGLDQKYRQYAAQ